MAQINTWLGFVIDPTGPTVQVARDKHLLVMKLLEVLVGVHAQGHREGTWETPVSYDYDLLPPDQVSASAFWAWEQACKKTGQTWFSDPLLRGTPAGDLQSPPQAELPICSGVLLVGL